MARRYIPPVDPGLSAASGIAQGAANFMQAFQGAQKDRRQMAIQEQQLKAQRELQALQMEKLRQEIAPVELNMGKINTFLNLAGFNVPGAEAIAKGLMKETADQIKTPQQLEYVNNAVSRQFEVQPSAPINIGTTGSSAPISIAARPPGTISFTRQEFDAAMKMQGALAQGAIAKQRIQARETLAEKQARLRAELEQAEREARAEQARLDREARAEQARLDREFRAGSKQNPEITNILTTARSLLTKYNTPPAGIPGLMESSDATGRMREQRVAPIRAQFESLRRQYKALTGKELNLSLDEQPAAPAPTPAAPPAQPPAASGAALEVTTKDQLRAAPEGSVVRYLGKTYKKTGNKLEEVK